MRLLVKDYLNRDIAISYNAENFSLFQEIGASYLDASNPIILDFKGITEVFAIFYNRLLLDAVDKFGLYKAEEIITFENVPNEHLFSSCKKHVWNYLTNPKYKKAVDLLHKKIGDDFI